MQDVVAEQASEHAAETEKGNDKGNETKKAAEKATEIVTLSGKRRRQTQEKQKQKQKLVCLSVRGFVLVGLLLVSGGNNSVSLSCEKCWHQISSV